VPEIVIGTETLQHRHDRKRQLLVGELVVPLDRQPLVLSRRQPRLSQHEGLAHVILRHGADDAWRQPASFPQVLGVLSARMPVAAVQRQF
jgi:hypothetical protein